MRTGHRDRLLRWVAGAAAVISGIVTAVLGAAFVPSYLREKDPSDKSGFLGTILGALATVVLSAQWLHSIVKREPPQGLADRLRSKTGESLDLRLTAMRRTSEDIALAYWGAADAVDNSLDVLTTKLLDNRERVVVEAHPGRGKSYTALQIALAVIRSGQPMIPLVVPLSRYGHPESISDWLTKLIAAEFNVTIYSARELVDSGKVLPLLDGLDELCTEETQVVQAELFLERLLEWRLQGAFAPFLLTCRRTTWRAIREDLRHHHSLTTFAIRPVQYGDAARYLARSLGGTNDFAPAIDLAQSLRTSGGASPLSTPWQLSLIAELARGRQEADTSSAGRDLVTAVEAADMPTLVGQYVDMINLDRRQQRWLSTYATYLERNRVESRIFDGRQLPGRDLVLHRLWPVAGTRAPRVADFLLCLVLSIPGFVWLTAFLWERGWLARVPLIAAAVIWSLMLVRTSTKPWVPPATPDWTRLSDPRFFLRQMGAALAIGCTAWLIIGPTTAAICFVTAWLAIGLTVGFGQTLATDAKPEIVGPDGVLRREHTVSRLSAAVVLPLLAAGFVATWGWWPGLPLAIVYGVLVGETVASALWRRYLAMIIVSIFRLPLAPARAMERMAELGLLRGAGMSYQFRHDDLLSHFAKTSVSRRPK